MDAEDFDRDQRMTPTALTIRKGTEYATMQLAQTEELLGLSCAAHTHLTQTRYVLARTRRISVYVAVAQRTWLHGESLTRQQ